MQDIKHAYQTGRLTAVQAAKTLTAWNGGTLAGNMTIIRRWNRG